MAHAAIHWNGALPRPPQGGNYKDAERRGSSHTESEAYSSIESSDALTYSHMLTEDNTEDHNYTLLTQAPGEVYQTNRGESAVTDNVQKAANAHASASTQPHIRVLSSFTQHRAYAAIMAGRCELLRECLIKTSGVAADTLVKPAAAAADRLQKLLPVDTEYGSSYLHVAADAARPDTELRFVPIIHELALAGVDPQIADKKGRTALDIAVAKSLWDIALALIRIGATTASRETGQRLRSDAAETLNATTEAAAATEANRMATRSARQQCIAELAAHVPPLGQAVRDGDYGRVVQLLSSWHRVANVRHGDELLTDLAMRLHAKTRTHCAQQDRHDEQPHQLRRQEQQQQQDRLQHRSIHQHRQTSSAGDDDDDTATPEAAAQASAAAVLEAIETDWQQDEQFVQQQQQHAEEKADVREAQRRAKMAHVLRHYERPAEFVQAALAGNVARMRDLTGGITSPAECVALLALAYGEQALTDGSKAATRWQEQQQQQQQSWQQPKPKDKEQQALRKAAERLGHGAAVTELLESCLAAAASTVAAATKGTAAPAASRTDVTIAAATAESQVAAVKGHASPPPGTNDCNIRGQTHALCSGLARQASTTGLRQPASVWLSSAAAVDEAADEKIGCLPPTIRKSPTAAAPFELEIRVPSLFTEHRAYAAITGGSCELLRDCLDTMATAAENSPVDGQLLLLPVDTEYGSSYLHVAADAARSDTELRFVPMIHELALAGVDPQIADNRGRTALDIAMAKGLHELSVALLRVGATASHQVRHLLTENLGQIPAADVTQLANDTADGSQAELHGITGLAAGPYAQATPLGQAVQEGDYGRVMHLLSRWHRVANVRHRGKLLADVAMRLHAETRTLCTQQDRHKQQPHQPRHQQQQQQQDHSQHSSTLQHHQPPSAGDDASEATEATAQASAAAVLEAIVAERQQDEQPGQQQQQKQQREQTEEKADVREAQRRAKVAHVLRHYERPAEFVQAVLAGNVAKMRQLAAGVSSPAECVALLALACGEQLLTDGSKAASRRRHRHPQRKPSQQQQHKQELMLCMAAERLGHGAGVMEVLRSYLAAAADTVAAATADTVAAATAASKHATVTAKLQTVTASTAVTAAAAAPPPLQSPAVQADAACVAQTAAVFRRCSVEATASLPTDEAGGSSFRYQVPAYGQAAQSKPAHSAACSIL